MSEENLSDLWLLLVNMRIPVVIPLTYAIFILPHKFVVWGDFHHLKNSDGKHLENHNAFKDITTALFWCLSGKIENKWHGMRAVY